MTKFAQSKFSVGVGSAAYRDNFEATFGPKPTPDVLKSLPQEEYDKLEPPTESELQAALDQGRAEADGAAPAS